MKKTLSFVLSVAVPPTSSPSPPSLTKPRKKRQGVPCSPLRSKRGEAALGTGKSTRVRVLLNDKTKYHGYITEIRDEYFVVTEAKTGATAPIAYPEVKGIKGNNLSTGAKIGIGVGIAAAAALIAVIVSSRGGDDNRQNGDIICATAPCVQ